MKTKVKELLENKLPKGFNIIVQERTDFMGGQNLKIGFSPNTIEINNVKGQYPQLVSLNLNLDTLELHPQVYGGMGGQSITRNINPDFPNEKYLAMKSVRVPFRKPKCEEKNVLKAIDTFIDRYMTTLRENFGLLRYKDVIDYSFLNDN